MPYSHIVWDFNGTILDDVESAVLSTNTLLCRRQLKMLSGIVEYRSVFGFPIVDYYKKIGFDFEVERYDDIAVEWVEQYLLNSKSAPLRAGVAEALAAIGKKGIPQLILSASEATILKKQLDDLGIREYFTNVLGLDNLYAHSKKEMALKWAREANPRKALMIGDTVHDHEVAAAIGADCILIAGGHQSRETLQTCGVTILGNAAELPELLATE